MPVPLQAPTFKKEDLEDPSLSFFNQWVAGVVQSINAQAGHAGPIQLNGHLNLNGNRIMNVGAAVDDTDAVSQGVATNQFGAEALRPQIEAMGKKVLATSRRLNDQTQRENYSSFLNSMVSTAPTSNDSLVTFGAPGGGTIDVTVSAGHHFYVDGSQVTYAGRTDTLTLPVNFAIVSLTRTGGVVTAVTATPNPFAVGETIAIAGAVDPTFDGAFVITAIIDPTHFQYEQVAPDATTTGGNVSLGGIYYYYIEKGTNTLALTNNAFGTGDTWRGRLVASPDGQTIIAVVSVNGPGGSDPANSAAGATQPITGSNSHIFGRL